MGRVCARSLLGSSGLPVRRCSFVSQGFRGPCVSGGLFAVAYFVILMPFSVSFALGGVTAVHPGVGVTSGHVLGG